MSVAVSFHGTLYGFEASNQSERRQMQKLFPEAQWLGRTMYAEHRYAKDVGHVIEEQVAALVRYGDEASITVDEDHGFVLKRKDG